MAWVGAGCAAQRTSSDSTPGGALLSHCRRHRPHLPEARRALGEILTPPSQRDPGVGRWLGLQTEASPMPRRPSKQGQAWMRCTETVVQSSRP